MSRALVCVAWLCRAQRSISQYEYGCTRITEGEDELRTASWGPSGSLSGMLVGRHLIPYKGLLQLVRDDDLAAPSARTLSKWQ